MSVLGLKTNVSRLLHTIQINKKSLGGGGGGGGHFEKYEVSTSVIF